MIFINEEEGFPMKRRAFSLLLALGLLCSLFPAASAEEGSPSAVTALCVAEPGQSVFLDEKEFQLLCRQSTGHDLESVTFSLLSAGVGKLTCRGERVTAEDAYYMYRSPAISDVCFTPYAYSSASRFVGQAELAFTMTSDKEETVFGRLILYVPETPAAPAEERSLMDKTLTAKAGEPVDLCDHLPSTVSYTTGTSIYIGDAITSATFQLPFSSQGSLWLDYDHPEVARKLLPDEVLFPDKAPNYYNLTFVPTSREETKVQLVHTLSSEKKNLNVCLTLNFREDKEPIRPEPDIPTDIISPAIHFQDMAGWEWAVSAAEFLGKSGYFSSETAFAPGEEAARIDLVHALSLTAYSNFRRNTFPTPAFSDLPDDSELVQSVAALADRGLVLGDGEGRLLPNESITRQDALVIIYRAMMDRHKTLPLYGDLSVFSDAGDVAPYAQEAVTLLAARGIVLGDGTGKLDPLSPITRAEMACLLYRAFG